MKKIYLKALLLLALSCFAVACTDDPDDINNTPTIPTSYLKYNNQYFELSKGFLYCSDSYFNSYSIELTGPNVSYNSWMEELMGVDQGVKISLTLPENSISVPAGNYTKTGETVENYEYSYIRFDTNYSYTSWDDMPYLDLKDDTIYVSKTGNTYNIIYKGFDQESNPFEVKFKGTIDLVSMFK